MPENRPRNRRSLLGGFRIRRPRLLGRFKRRDSGGPENLKSPTSVADFPSNASKHESERRSYPLREINVDEHEYSRLVDAETHAHELKREIVSQLNSSIEESSFKTCHENENETASGTNEKRGQLLRDFSYPNQPEQSRKSTNLSFFDVNENDNFRSRQNKEDKHHKIADPDSNESLSSSSPPSSGFVTPEGSEHEGYCFDPSTGGTTKRPTAGSEPESGETLSNNSEESEEIREIFVESKERSEGKKMEEFPRNEHCAKQQQEDSDSCVDDFDSLPPDVVDDNYFSDEEKDDCESTMGSKKEHVDPAEVSQKDNPSNLQTNFDVTEEELRKEHRQADGASYENSKYPCDPTDAKNQTDHLSDKSTEARASSLRTIGESDHNQQHSDKAAAGKPTSIPQRKSDQKKQHSENAADGNDNDPKASGSLPTEEEIKALLKRNEPVTVRIVKGSYKDWKTGKVMTIKNKVKVSLEHKDFGLKVTWLPRSSLMYKDAKFPLCKEDSRSKKKETKESSEDRDEAFVRGDRVAIVGGAYKNKKGTVIDVRKSVKVEIDGEHKAAWLYKKSLQNLEQSADCDGEGFYDCHSTDEGGHERPVHPRRASRTKRETIKTGYICESDTHMSFPDKDKGGTVIGGRRVVQQKLEREPACDNILLSWMKNRVIVNKTSMNKGELEEKPLIHYEMNESRYELVVTKKHGDGDKAAPPGAPTPGALHSYYCQVTGPGLETVSLQQELEWIGDFGSLPPEKVTSRLELLLSTAYKFPYSMDGTNYCIKSLEKTAFAQIKEAGNEGCGFICENLLLEILGNGKPAERADCIQVRGISDFGFFKGMLVKKKMKKGEKSIHIPPSMIVVGPSKKREATDKALLLVAKNGAHPNSTNQMLGRYFRGEGTTKTHRHKMERKSLSDMILRLWRGLGVPESLCKVYDTKAKREENLNHAYVMGLADPTAELPPGSAFIPGLDHDGEIFVTRSPCLEKHDARMIPVITTKPERMKEENWEFLQTFSFGSIIFSSPLPGDTPTPVMIADGDLDGDLYFICWNQEILKHMKCEPIMSLPAEPKKPIVVQYRSNWLEEAQRKMVDAKRMQLLDRIIGKLFNKAKEISEQDGDFANNEDHSAFATAYKQALKLGKHGGKIYLPARLIKGDMEEFSYILTDEEDESSY